MASNSNTAYLQYWEDFSLLGKSMKRYAIALSVSISATIVGGFIIFIAFMVVMMSSYTEYSSLIGLGIIAILFIIVVLIIGIYRLITYIQFLIQLKINIGGSLLSFEMLESDYYSYIFLFLGYIIVIVIVVMLSIIFQLISSLALDRWAQRIKTTNFRNRDAIKIADGTSFMKFGRIILIVAPPIAVIMSYMGLFGFVIGIVLVIIGFIKAGKGIMEFFDGYGNYISNEGSAFTQSSSSSTLQLPRAPTTNPNLNSTHMTNTSIDRLSKNINSLLLIIYSNVFKY